MSDVRIGIIGGGLMGRELAAVCGRWLHLVDHPVRPSVVAVADLDPAAREWFRQVPTLETLTDSWRDLVDDDSLDVLYIAVPHNLHEEIYTAAARAGRDFLAEKPFGIDLGASNALRPRLTRPECSFASAARCCFFPVPCEAMSTPAVGSRRTDRGALTLSALVRYRSIQTRQLEASGCDLR